MINFFFLLDTLYFLSLSNFALLLWLGLTVIINSDNRRPGVMAAGIALLLGSVFFLFHTILLTYEISLIFNYLNSIVRLLSIIVIILPFAWYLLILWYAGHFNDLNLPHRYFLLLLTFLGTAQITVLLLFPEPDKVLIGSSGNNIYLLAGFSIYAFFMLACTGLAIFAVLKPGKSHRLLGQLARQKARPWLILASFFLLMVSFLVMIFLFLFYFNYAVHYHKLQPEGLFRLIYKYDFYISSFIMLAVLALSQAIVSYEIFTGKTLPRKNFSKNLYYTVFIVIAYSLLIAFVFDKYMISTYHSLLTLVIISFLSVLFSRSFFQEQANYRNILSNNLLNQHFTDQHQDSAILQKQLEIIGHEILDTSQLHLYIVNNPFVETDLLFSFPAQAQMDKEQLKNLYREFLVNKEELIIVGEKLPDYIFALPLYDKKALRGIILLGRKKNHSLYSQEEIKIVETLMERLLEQFNNRQMYQLLLAHEKNKLKHAMIQDRQLYRVLHDEILPEIHLLMLELNNQGNQILVDELASVHNELAELLHKLPSKPNIDIEKNGLYAALQNFTITEVKMAFNRINFESEEAALAFFAKLPVYMQETLFYAAVEIIRNAAKYAAANNLPLEKLELKINFLAEPDLKLVIEDNGVGLSKSDNPNLSGSRKGLQLHSVLMKLIGGELEFESIPVKATRVTLTLPQNTLYD